MLHPGDLEREEMFALLKRDTWRISFWLVLWGCLLAGSLPLPRAWGKDLRVTSDHVLNAIYGGRRALCSRQQPDGSFPADGFLTHPVGTTAVAALALRKTATALRDPGVDSALQYLRRQSWGEIERTHELALGLMAFVTAAESQDEPLISLLAERLIQAQTEQGGWTHRIGGVEGDLSLSSFVLLGLREAMRSGEEIPRDVWRKSQTWWISQQNPDGGWDDFSSLLERSGSADSFRKSTPTGTLAGISVLKVCAEMLARSVAANSSGPMERDGGMSSGPALERAVAWMKQVGETRARLFSAGSWLTAFHLYGLEVSQRMQGEYFAGERAWYHAGVESLLVARNPHSEAWDGTNDVIATSFALIHLSAEVAPLMVAKLRFDGTDRENVHAFHDGWHLTEFATRFRHWPRVPCCRECSCRELIRDVPAECLALVTQLPVEFAAKGELESLRQFLERGGTLLATPDSDRESFEKRFLLLLNQLYPDDECRLVQLGPDHPVFHEPCSVSVKAIPLYGLETGCRTAIFYCPEAMASQWHQAFPDSLRRRSGSTEQQQMLNLGVNLITAAAGDLMPPFPLRFDSIVSKPESSLSPEDHRNLVRVAHLRCGAGWNVAPRALATVLQQVNRSHGELMSPMPQVVDLGSEAVFDEMLLFLHGHTSFAFSELEVQHLRQQLQNGGVLFADACCGSAEFDASFRKEITRLFPGKHLQPIARDHEFFSEGAGRGLESVRLRVNESDGTRGRQEIQTLPVLEGLELNGRLAVIYSRYDISCALGKSAGRECAGYVPEDALRIASRVLIYALIQDFHPAERLR